MLRMCVCVCVCVYRAWGGATWFSAAWTIKVRRAASRWNRNARMIANGARVTSRSMRNTFEREREREFAFSRKFERCISRGVLLFLRTRACGIRLAGTTSRCKIRVSPPNWKEGVTTGVIPEGGTCRARGAAARNCALNKLYSKLLLRGWVNSFSRGATVRVIGYAEGWSADAGAAKSLQVSLFF